MSKLLRTFTAELGTAVGDLGFKRRGSLLIREDSLVRAIRVDVMRNTRVTGELRFHLLFELGIPGLSEVAGRESSWVVWCTSRRLPLADGGVQNPPFTLTGEDMDTAVIERAVSCARTACDEFLLRYEDAPALHRLVQDSALQFTELGMELHDDYWRLGLEPWNAIVRLELAGVYASFLGLGGEAESVLAAAARFATGRNKGLDVYLPRVRENVELAGRKTAAH